MHKISDKAFVSSDVILEDPVNITAGCEINALSKIGAYTYLNRDCKLYGNCEVGRYCSFGRDVHVGLHEHPIDWLSTHPFQYSNGQFQGDTDYECINRKYWKDSKVVKIGSDVWIGTGSRIFVGVEVGHGSIIAAGSIVTKDVAPYSIVGGVPAKLIKTRFPEGTINKLLELKWWLLPISSLKNIEFNDIDLAMSQLKNIKEEKGYLKCLM
ncbi:MAG: CatB-related O-acetyltransferase [Colwellia sp.]|jgi:Acetyltransferase (isoleucine patch superfamily)